MCPGSCSRRPPGVSLDGMSGGFGFPFGCVAAVAAVILADLAGATVYPWYALVTLGAVVLATAFRTSLSAAAGVAVVAWALDSGFVLGRAGDSPSARLRRRRPGLRRALACGFGRAAHLPGSGADPRPRPAARRDPPAPPFPHHRRLTPAPARPPAGSGGSPAEPTLRSREIAPQSREFRLSNHANPAPDHANRPSRYASRPSGTRVRRSGIPNSRDQIRNSRDRAVTRVIVAPGRRHVFRQLRPERS